MLLGLAVNVAANLLAAAIQQKYFAGQFTGQTLWGLAIFAVLGSLVGLWLGGPVRIPPVSAVTASLPGERARPVTITRLQALLSYARLKGKGIHLSDILLIGSRIDIDSEE
ncbi:MAG: hypothetical protein AB1801_20315 [Chloroflexota bacterium]